MVFNVCSLMQLKEINRLRKEVNRLLSKGMLKMILNIDLKILLRKIDVLKNFGFLSLKSSSPCQLFGSSNKNCELKVIKSCYELELTKEKREHFLKCLFFPK